VLVERPLHGAHDLVARLAYVDRQRSGPPRDFEINRRTAERVGEDLDVANVVAHRVDLPHGAQDDLARPVGVIAVGDPDDDLGTAELPAGAHGDVIGEPGTLNLNGFEYAQAYDQLQLNFDAVGSLGYSQSGNQVVSSNDLTLQVVDADFSMNSTGPVSTRAVFQIWNMNETKFSGTTRCLTCWDQSLLSSYEWPNNFLLANLQTFVGKARIDGVASVGCDSVPRRRMLPCWALPCES